ncbi:MAG: S-methyl-5'-thioadenosine phosphorylase [Candidatus Bathyarchaeota archaeon]
MVDEGVEIGIIGGSGIYDPEILEDVKEIKVYTPFGPTSSLISIGYYKDRKVAFISRHGPKHQIPPHRIPFRANVWALRELGVKRIISPSAVGSLREDYRPSEFVLIDQFVDRTKWRGDTFYDGGQVCHISTADPFCSELREVLLKSGKEMKILIHEIGTYVCIQGPRFSTRAESRLFRSWGCDVVGMTLFPEVALAREAEICYASIAMVTDYDVWAEKPVSTSEIFKVMSKNVENFKKLVVEVIPRIPPERKCLCKEALKDALI